MKKIIAILAALTLAAPANAFIVVPEEDKGPEVNKTKLDLHFCYDVKGTDGIKTGTWNRKCVDIGRKTEMWWTGAEKCDEFEGCVKVGMLMVNEFYDTAYYEGSVYNNTFPILH